MPTGASVLDHHHQHHQAKANNKSDLCIERETHTHRVKGLKAKIGFAPTHMYIYEHEGKITQTLASAISHIGVYNLGCRRVETTDR